MNSKFRTFGFIEVLKSQDPKLHEVLLIEHDQRYIFYLVLKVNYWPKTDLEALYSTFINLLQNVTEVTCH